MSKLTDAQRRKKKSGLCIIPYCRKEHIENKNICYKHKGRLYAKRNPLKYRYFKIRYRAKYRGIPFKLTFEHFEKIAIAGGYDKNSGSTKRKLHVDRIDATRGYIDGNIQILSCSANSRKGYDERGRIINIDEDVPF